MRKAEGRRKNKDHRSLVLLQLVFFFQQSQLQSYTADKRICMTGEISLKQWSRHRHGGLLAAIAVAARRRGAAIHLREGARMQDRSGARASEENKERKSNPDRFDMFD
jgi:hypothetical protein